MRSGLDAIGYAGGLARLPRAPDVVVPGEADALHVDAPALFLEHVMSSPP
jgi:hypothetical protein